MNRFNVVILSIIFHLGASGAVNAQQSSPTACYMELHKKELAATSYTDLYQVRSQTSIAHDKPMSKEELNFIFPLFKASLPKEVIVTSEQVNGTSAILKAIAKPRDAAKQNPRYKVSESTTGEIELTLENGQWKIEHEKWDSKIVMR
ncbi:MAG: hypothetical protein U0103_16125 [Candidatus Obscuribacterales bacterium]